MWIYLLLLGLLALPAHAQLTDYGSFTYELYQQMQESHLAQTPPPLTPMYTPAIHCGIVRKTLSCRDDRHRYYRCVNHGAAGQYCQREDRKAWIHCYRRLFGRYQCSVISSQVP
jgi:hypothetical protein